MNWYGNNSILEDLEKGEPLYDKKHIKHLDGYVKNQKGFLKRIKGMLFNPSKPVNDISFKRYEQYMTLVKEYDGIFKFSPPFDVDIVWHAHMLDQETYVKDTKAFFGRVLNHDDSEKVLIELKKYEGILPKLWEKHYGKNSYKLTDALKVVDKPVEVIDYDSGGCWGGCG